MDSKDPFISPVVSPSGEPYGMYLVQFPGYDWRVYSDYAEAVSFRDAMVQAMARVSPEED